MIRCTVKCIGNYSTPKLYRFCAFIGFTKMQSRANIITSRWKVCFRKTIFSKFNTNLLDCALYFYKLVLVTDPFYHFSGIHI